jgi:hypothetical protein
MQLEGYVVTWEEFRTTFRAHHIPEGLIERVKLILDLFEIE